MTNNPLVRNGISPIPKVLAQSLDAHICLQMNGGLLSFMDRKTKTNTQEEIRRAVAAGPRYFSVRPGSAFAFSPCLLGSELWIKSSAKTRLETRGISHAVTRNWKGKENTPVEEVFGHLRDVFERKSGVAVAGSAGEVRVTGARVARG